MDEVLRNRLLAVRDSQKRVRLVLFASLVISLVMVIVAWNAYLSWYRGFLLKENWSQNEVTQFAQKELVSEWIKSRVVNVPFLGIHVAISDASVLGSLSMLVVTMWFWFCAKQENQTIGRLLVETQKSEGDQRRLIFHDITSYMVFTTVSQHEGPIKHLSTKLDTPVRITVQSAFALLIFSPPISVFFLIAIDFLSLFAFPPPFRYPHSQHLYEFMTRGDWLWYGLVTGLALMILTLITSLSWSISQHVHDTAKVLQEYSNELTND